MNVHFSSERQDWQTPDYIFKPLHAEFFFTLDACALPHNAMLPRFYTPTDDGLTRPWEGERVWCNPPYGRELPKWVEKMATSDADLVVGFIPSRTDTRWFHKHIQGKAEIRFLRGRVKFVGAEHSAPFPSMLCIWHY